MREYSMLALVLFVMSVSLFTIIYSVIITDAPLDVFTTLAY